MVAWFGQRDTAFSPFSDVVDVDVSANDVTLSDGCKGLFIGGVGNVNVRTVSGSADHVFPVIAAPFILPGRFTIVRKSGTTATSIRALF